MMARTRTIVTTRLLMLLLVASSCFRTPTTTHVYSWFGPSTLTTRKNSRPISQQQQQEPPPQHNPRQQHAPRVTSRSDASTTKKNEGRLIIERPQSPGRSRTVTVPGEQRRNFLNMATCTTLAAATWAVVLPSSSSSKRAQAVMQNPPDNVFQVGKDLSLAEAEQRFQQGQTSLDYLLEQYEMICDQGGGDNIRRYLGTVGMTSGLYGITKVLKVLQDTFFIVTKNNGWFWVEFSCGLQNSLQHRHATNSLKNFGLIGFHSRASPSCKNNSMYIHNILRLKTNLKCFCAVFE